MKEIVALFSLKILSFVGATANTLGFVTFFWLDGLVPYRWYLIIGGLLLIGIATLTELRLAKKMAAEPEETPEVFEDPHSGY